ncbi:MAG: O-acetylhomoserine aminocarboxypropyltransferase/cysteine synthase [Candidatus Gastranaerophilales bacterium]|nr:O-acetylhomoserine aminocarboxypropyltransferase/cysteine synthase [Candidatus Gastranaerophilales bacterium]
MKDSTIEIHGAQEPDKATNSRALPIYQTTAFAFDSSEHAKNLFNLTQAGNIYTRLMNPTTDVLEKRLAMLEHGAAALAVSSGMSAIFYTILNIAMQGDEIVSSSSIYGGTHTLFQNTLPNLGIKTHFVKSADPLEFEKAITPKTKLIFAETIANPRLTVADIEGLAEIAHKHNIPLVIDSTVSTPSLLKPVDFGADIVIHSATKYLGGHGTSMCGIVVDSGKFDWTKSGKFSTLTDKDPSYHGLSYTEAFGNCAFIAKMRVKILRDTGAALSPFNAFLILQGIETLSLRMKKHSENALKVAEFLKLHPGVGWVIYPGLKDDENYTLAQKYLPSGQSGIVAFGIKGGKEAGVKFIDSVKLLSHIANIGDAKSLVIHPASTTHQQLNPQEQEAAGLSEDFIRLSIGIEDIEDIIEDINQALEKSQI